MALDRLLRLRRQLSDSAKAEASRKNAEARLGDERVAFCRGATERALGESGVATLELLAEASVHALEARRVARARAELAAADAVAAHREMRQVEIVVEQQHKHRVRKKADAAQMESDEYASRLRRAAR